jgi:hypothetical protein
MQDPDACLGWVIEINEAYVKLQRTGQEAQEIVNLKLSTIFWRSRFLERFLTRPPSWAAARQEITLLILKALHVALSPQQLQIAAKLLEPPAMAQLMAAQGKSTPGFPGLDRESGPGVELNIVANRGSSTPYEKWRKNELFGRYEFEGDGVRYRGVFYRPGDVLLANVNLDGNGVYTSLSEPRSFSSHSAFFAILEHDGRRLPVVIETFEKGVRPVPISVFLGPKFCSYVEVYRHREYSEQNASRLNQAAAEMIDSVLGYNFDTEDPDPAYVSCTSVGRFLHKAAGLKPADTISRLSHPQIQANLGELGYTWFDLFGPVDFLLNDYFECVGFVDNNQPERLLARELIDQEFLRHFKSCGLDAGQFPFPSKINRWGLGHMRKQTMLGRLFGWFEGFTADTLPKGPDELMAAIKPVEKQMGKIILKTRETVEEVLADTDHLDMAVFNADERILECLQQNFKLPWLQIPGTALAEARQAA